MYLKVENLLAGLSKTDLKHIRELSATTYFGVHTRLTKLIDHLLLNYPEITLDKPTIFNILYPKRPYRAKTVNEYFSYLKDLIDQYLLIQQLKQTPSIQDHLLLEAYQGGPFEKNQVSFLKHLNTQIDQEQTLDSSSFYHHYKVAEAEDQYFIRKGQRKKHSALQQKADALERHFVLNRLIATCEMLSRQNIVDATFDLGMTQALLSYIASQPHCFQEPIIQTYLLLLNMLMRQEEEGYYQLLKQSLPGLQDHITREELIKIYQFAQNYCIHKINQGKQLYLEELFDIYGLLLDQGFLLENEQIPYAHYKNMVTLGLRLKKFDWTYNFMQAYKDHIPAPERENAYAYNLAYYHFEKKEYDQAAQLLISVEFTDVFYSLDAKTMLLKIYFEEEEEDAFFSLLESFRIFVLRNKQISTTQRKAYLGMLRYIKRIYKLNHQQGLLPEKEWQQKHQKLKQQLDGEREIANVNWLYDKL